MATKQVTASVLTGYDTGYACADNTATAAADGFTIAADGNLLLIVTNSASSAGTITIKKGNGAQAGGDKQISVAASSSVAVKIESGRYKNVSGANKGKYVVIPSATTLTLRAIQL